MDIIALGTVLLVGTMVGNTDTLDAFKARIESAYAQQEKAGAVKGLFYREGFDQEREALLDRVLKHLTRRNSAEVTFVSIPPEAQLVAVVDGYEYRPNLEVIGFADLGKNEAGGTTQVPYGQGPDGRFYFTATTRTLVNPDTPPDKQLQMIAIGGGYPAITFEGWCDILLSNNQTIRKTLSDQGMGNQTMILRGQAIQGCEIINTSGRGTLSLRLLADETLLFEHRIEAPSFVIRFSP